MLRGVFFDDFVRGFVTGIPEFGPVRLYVWTGGETTTWTRRTSMHDHGCQFQLVEDVPAGEDYPVELMIPDLYAEFPLPFRLELN